MADNERIRQHFQRSISSFDLIYSERKGRFKRFVDNHFRQDIYERYELTLQECKDIGDKRILDVGCGSGRYSIGLAQYNPAQIVGIDFSKNAIELANKFAQDNGISNLCSFINGDFTKYQFDTKFHTTLAIGLFDYIADPVSVISKMRNITLEKIIMSFPSKSTYRMAIRKMRYRLMNCPLFMYDKEKLQTILAESDIQNYTIRKLYGTDNSGDFFVVAKL